MSAEHLLSNDQWTITRQMFIKNILSIQHLCCNSISMGRRNARSVYIIQRPTAQSVRSQLDSYIPLVDNEFMYTLCCVCFVCLFIDSEMEATRLMHSDKTIAFYSIGALARELRMPCPGVNDSGFKLEAAHGKSQGECSTWHARVEKLTLSHYPHPLDP